MLVLENELTIVSQIILKIQLRLSIIIQYGNSNFTCLRLFDKVQDVLIIKRIQVCASVCIFWNPVIFVLFQQPPGSLEVELESAIFCCTNTW